jgi:hypothetical protein
MVSELECGGEIDDRTMDQREGGGDGGLSTVQATLHASAKLALHHCCSNPSFTAPSHAVS